MIAQLLANSLSLASNYVLLALGFAIIFGTTRIFHFAHGSVYGIAAYVFLLAETGLQLPVALAVVVSIGVATLVGVLVDVLAYEPLIRRNSSPLALFVTSLGLYIILYNVISLPYGRTVQAFPNTIFPSNSMKILGFFLTPTQIANIGITAALVVAVLVFLLRTRLGIAIRALAGDPHLAEIIGVDVPRTRVAVFAIGSLLAACASVLIALDVGAIDPSITLVSMLVAAIAVIVGGIGSIVGAALAGVLLAVLRTFAEGVISSQWSDVIVYSLLLAVVVFRPTGILGRRLSRLGR